ncbi:MAG: hypothetical protein ACXW30_02890 [Micavibrio sp.]
MRILSILMFSLFLTAPALARDVSYAGGWTLMLHNNAEMNAAHLHYSPTARYSVGWMHEYMRGPDANMDAAQINWLVKRWNMPAAQANIYLKSGAGVTYDGDDIEPTAYTGIAADWENRRLFTSYENRFLYAGEIEKFAEHKARVGVAPYIADFGGIHTWLMLEAGYNAKRDNEFTTTPLVRVFTGPVLVEGGYNIQDKTALFNAMYRF